eukprot:Platyproteum_vivax@DN2040_c0_g1_i1.p1
MMTAEFIKLIHRMVVQKHGEFFTQEELDFFEGCFRMLRLRGAETKLMRFKEPFTPVLKEAIIDKKVACKECKNKRSFTIIENGSCGDCLWIKTTEYQVELQMAQRQRNDLKSQATDTTSHLVQCKLCISLYSVVDIDRLNIPPKCHYCRKGLPCPSVVCSKCQNKYVYPDCKDKDAFICPTCEADPQKGLVEGSMSLKALLDKTPDLMHVFGFDKEDEAFIFTTKSLFKLLTESKKGEVADEELDKSDSEKSDKPKDKKAKKMEKSGKAKEEAEKTKQKNVQKPPPPDLFYKADRHLKTEAEFDQLYNAANKPIVDTKALVKRLINDVMKGALRSTCYLCFNDVVLRAIAESCGNCPNTSCNDCLGTWYSEVAPGKLALPSHLQCPFCKQRPKAATLKKYNKLAMAILEGVESASMRTDMYYGWCLTCFKIKEMMERVCGGEELPRISDFKCEECSARVLETGNQKYWKCPGCQAPTQKTYGCNHITCLCGTHWCYGCGEAFDEANIYEHMYQDCPRTNETFGDL